MCAELKQLSLFYDDFDYDSLGIQLKLLSNIFTSSQPVTVTDIARQLNSSEGARVLIPDLVRLVKLALVVPATSASAERSFSALRRVKTYLRSTTEQGRLNHLLILHCHRDCVDQLDLKSVAQEFNKIKKRSVFFGNF